MHVSLILIVPGRGNTRERSHTPTGETRRTCLSLFEEDGPWELDGVLCHHRTPLHIAHGPGGVPDSAPPHLPPRGKNGGAEAECPLVEEDLEETLAGSLIQGAYRLRWATKTGAWLTVQKSTVNGTELGAQEWRDYLFLRYSLDPPDLPHYCNGCKPTFSICHALDCKRGRLSWHVTTRSVTGSQTWPEKLSPPLTCATTPSSSYVAPWRGRRQSRPYTKPQQSQPTRHH